MITVERSQGMTRVTFPHDEVPMDRLNALLDWLREPQTNRVTAVEPLPRAEWERIYSLPDEVSSEGK